MSEAKAASSQSTVAMTGQDKQLYDFGPFRVDSAERSLRRGGEVVPMTAKVFDLLLLLIRHRGRALSKDELMSKLWPDAAVEENNLTVNMSALRKALGDDSSQPHYVETIPRRGYRFIAEVREVASEGERHGAGATIAEPATNSASESVGAATLSGEAVAIEPKVRWPRREVLRFSLVAVVLVALTLALYALLIRAKRPTPPSPINSLVVLPLENLSGDAAQEYFADGMTDALIGELAKIGALRVISRTSAMYYKGTKKKLPEIAGELKVEAVVEGTVVRSGDRVRVRVQLIRATDDQHVWSETYDYDLRDVLALQSQVARAIAREVQIKITPDEQARLTSARPVKGIALDHYLQGLYHLNRRTEEPLKKAVKYFESAIEEDSAYAQAYVGLAECYSALGTVKIGSMPPTEALRLGGTAASKALEIDSELADAHAALGKVLHYEWDWSAAEQEFKRAIELNPSHAFAHNSYAYLLSSLGRAEEALAEIKRAEELDPLSSPSMYRAYVLYMARRFDEAIEHYRRVITEYPDDYFVRWNLGNAYAAKSKYAEAIASFEKAAALSGRSPGALGSLGMVYALSGRRAEAQKLLDELIELAEHTYVTPAAIAWIHIGLGNKDQAFEWLEKAYQERSYLMAYIKVMAAVDPVRSDPRFDDLLRRVGLAQ